MTPDALAEALANMVRRNKELVQELAIARQTIEDERAFHALRSAALNRTGEDNDQLRATLARCNCANSQEPRP